MEEKTATPHELQEILTKDERSEPDSLVQKTVIRVAPTPHPEELKALKKINSKYPDMVLGMATKEQRFRHISTYLGQFNFLLIPGMGYTAAVALGYAGLEVASSVAIVATTYLAYVFKTNNPKPPKIDVNNDGAKIGVGEEKG